MEQKRTARVPVLMTVDEKRALIALAERRYQTRAEVVRELVRDAAGKLGLWPPQEVAQPQ